jgi:hypothetical protein
MNTAVRRRHSLTHTKLVEVIETQGKQIVSNMEKMSNMEERKVLVIGEIANKQLQYFKIRDSEIAMTQRGLVQAVNGLSAAIVQAYASRGGTKRTFNGQPLQQQSASAPHFATETWTTARPDAAPGGAPTDVPNREDAMFDL